MPFDLQAGYGAGAQAQALRQMMLDKLLAAKTQSDMGLDERKQSLLEAENQRRQDEFQQTLKERQAALGVGVQKERDTAAATGLNEIGMGGDVSNQQFAQTYKGTPSESIVPPLMTLPAARMSPVAGERATQEVPSTEQGIHRSIGTAPQQQAAAQKVIRGRFISGLDPGSPEARAASYEEAIGKPLPAGAFDKPTKPGEIKDTPKGLVRVGEDNSITPLGVQGYHPPAQGPANADRSRLDKSYDTQTKRLDSLEKPLADQAERIGRLRATMNQNSPQADTLIAPEILSVTAGGTGSGLRMNEAEIARIIGGRDKWEELKARLSAWQLDPTKPFSITTEQRKQMHDLANAIADRSQKRLSLIDEARGKLVDATDVQTHRQILNDVSRKLNEESLGTEPAGSPSGAPAGSSQGVPSVGATFQGGKVLKVEKVQ